MKKNVTKGLRSVYTRPQTRSLVVDVVPILAGSPPTQEHPTVTGDHQDANNEDGPQPVSGSSNGAKPAIMWWNE